MQLRTADFASLWYVISVWEVSHQCVLNENQGVQRPLDTHQNLLSQT